MLVNETIDAMHEEVPLYTACATSEENRSTFFKNCLSKRIIGSSIAAHFTALGLDLTAN